MGISSFEEYGECQTIVVHFPALKVMDERTPNRERDGNEIVELKLNLSEYRGV